MNSAWIFSDWVSYFGIKISVIFHRIPLSNDNFIIESLRIFLEDPRETSKTLFFILKNEDVEKARTVIDKTLGGIDKPNTGIMFGIDLTFVAGLNIE